MNQQFVELVIYFQELICDYHYTICVAVCPHSPQIIFDITFPIPISGLRQNESEFMSLDDLRLIFQVRATKNEKEIYLDDKVFEFLFNTIVRLTIEFAHDLQERRRTKTPVLMRYCRQATLGTKKINVGISNKKIKNFIIDFQDIPEPLRNDLLPG